MLAACGVLLVTLNLSLYSLTAILAWLFTSFVSIILQVERYSTTRSTGGGEMKELLKAIKDKCDRLHCEYPKYFCDDDVLHHTNTITAIFPEAAVSQDIKHCLDRLINETSTASPLYGTFAR